VRRRVGEGGFKPDLVKMGYHMLKNPCIFRMDLITYSYSEKPVLPFPSALRLVGRLVRRSRNVVYRDEGGSFSDLSFVAKAKKEAKSEVSLGRSRVTSGANIFVYISVFSACPEQSRRVPSVAK